MTGANEEMIGSQVEETVFRLAGPVSEAEVLVPRTRAMPNEHLWRLLAVVRLNYLSEVERMELITKSEDKQ